MDAEVMALIGTLREAQDVVRRELRPLVDAPAPDRDRLLRLRDASRAHGEHADTLVSVLSAHGVVGEVIDTVGGFLSFFRSAEEQTTALLRRRCR